MLKNFIIKAPEIEVITPQSEKKFRVRSLKLDEEYNIKSSMLSTASTINRKLNEMIYNTIIDPNKPNYDEFLKMISTKDRDALIYGLYQVTYGDEYPLENYMCPQCQKKQAIKIKMSAGFTNECFKAKMIKKKMTKEDGTVEEVNEKELPLLEQTVEVELEKNLYAIVHQASLADEQLILDKVNDDLQDDLLQKIKMFKITTSKVPEIYSLSETEIDYLYIYKQLYRKHKTIVNDAYKEKFGKYGTNVKASYKCTNCGYLHEFDVDFVQQFFLMVYQS